ncbi:hypothetical protein HK101_005657, partial [Irineochytrium annulatum]
MTRTRRDPVTLTLSNIPASLHDRHLQRHGGDVRAPLKKNGQGKFNWGSHLDDAQLLFALDEDDEQRLEEERREREMDFYGWEMEGDFVKKGTRRRTDSGDSTSSNSSIGSFGSVGANGNKIKVLEEGQFKLLRRASMSYT